MATTMTPAQGRSGHHGPPRPDDAQNVHGQRRDYREHEGPQGHRQGGAAELGRPVPPGLGEVAAVRLWAVHYSPFAAG